ncbi:class I SAM-dependent methyltransferase [Streptomyces roseolilacinus]|uniref:class I SAM-dependent methyltransferase n=1 Tax=Streptomyces roseolilacinus TaxID=66904 RepID=UPI00167B1FFC|nr:class I SAM-dependent methyltransferase [Streptomyces roseolilacinus]
MRKTVPRLGAVQESLLVPLYARAAAARTGDGLLDDPHAVAVVDSLDYDFGRLAGTGNLFGTVLRTLVFDAWTREFMERSPGGTVVELGAGLSTRFERVDDGRVRWLDVDLPDVVDLRGAFFPDGERRRAVAASVTDPAWTEHVLRLPPPYLLIAEAVLAYLPEDGVRRVFALAGDRLPGSVLAVDTVGRELLAEQDDPAVLGRLSARMRWSTDDPRAAQRWHPGVVLRCSVDFGRLPPSVAGRLRPEHRRALAAYGARSPGRVRAYRLNLYGFG